MSPDVKRAYRSVMAVIEMASTNVSVTDIRITTTGLNSAAVTVPAYALRRILKAADPETSP